MTVYGWIYYLVFFIILVLLVKPLGNYMSKVFQGETTFLSRLITPLERTFYRVTQIDPSDEMEWKIYAKTMLCFNFVGIVFLYLLMRFQVWLPLNPQSMPAVSPNLAINTAVSFVTNTNWQN
jgi:K+-transporting ATPase ATPase A chain